MVWKRVSKIYTLCSEVSLVYSLSWWSSSHIGHTNWTHKFSQFDLVTDSYAQIYVVTKATSH